jgi:hypothetical protein
LGDAHEHHQDLSVHCIWAWKRLLLVWLKHLHEKQLWNLRTVLDASRDAHS